MKKEYVGKECSDENYFQKYTIFNSYLQIKSMSRNLCKCIIHFYSYTLTNDR